MKRIINQELRLNQLVKVIVKKFGGNAKMVMNIKDMFITKEKAVADVLFAKN